MKAITLAIALLFFSSSAQAAIIVVCDGGHPDSRKPAKPVNCCTAVQRALNKEKKGSDYNLMKTFVAHNCKKK